MIDKNKHYEKISKIVNDHNIVFEGGIKGPKSHLLYGLVVAAEPKLVYEVGFNAGASAIILCESVSDNGKVVSFEIDETKKPIAEYLCDYYPNLEVIWGDSTLTVSKRFEQEEPDLAFIDGCHVTEIATKDLMIAKRIIKPGGYIIIDDTNHEWLIDAVNFAGIKERIIKFFCLSGIYIHQKAF